MILLLAGTGEARSLAARMAQAGLAAKASFAGALTTIETMPLPTRIGGFGGETCFGRYLEEQGVTAVIDATHPFAEKISARSFRICHGAGIPYLRLQRPEWTAQPEDNWTSVQAQKELSNLIPSKARIFLSVGRKEIGLYHSLFTRPVVMRSIDPPLNLPAAWRSVLGKPPFTIAQEVSLLREQRIDWLVTKNAGGPVSVNKLVAARMLGLNVAMISRPPLPNGITVVETADEAFAWAQSKMKAQP